MGPDIIGQRPNGSAAGLNPYRRGIRGMIRQELRGRECAGHVIIGDNR